MNDTREMDRVGREVPAPSNVSKISLSLCCAQHVTFLSHLEIEESSRADIPRDQEASNPISTLFFVENDTCIYAFSPKR